MERALFVPLIIFFQFLAYANEEFIVSYRLYTKNSLTVGENYFLSRPMTKTKKTFLKSCKIELKNKKITPYEFLQKQKDQVLNCLFSNVVFINSQTKSYQRSIHSQTALTIPPLTLTVDFNDGFAIINVFE